MGLSKSNNLFLAGDDADDDNDDDDDNNDDDDNDGDDDSKPGSNIAQIQVVWGIVCWSRV